MDAIRDRMHAVSAAEEGLSAVRIIAHHRAFMEALARPVLHYRQLFWGPIWFVGEAPKRSHYQMCQSHSRLARIWYSIQRTVPPAFLDLVDEPLRKSRSRWGDMRPPRMAAALGSRRLLRDAVGLSGTATGDLYVVLLGATVREAFGMKAMDQYEWFRIPRSARARGELFVATIPHPSPLAASSFDVGRVERLLWGLESARPQLPVPSRRAHHVDRFDLVPLDS